MNVSSLRISSLNVIPRGTSTRSPVLAIVGSLAAGALLAVALLLGPASGGSEPLVTGSVLFAFGLGWALMAVLTTRFSAQPQTWMAVPAAFLGSIGLGLIVFQPGPAVMDLLSWVWPPALAVLAIWMFVAGPAPAARPRSVVRCPGDRHAPGLRDRWRHRDRQCGQRSRRLRADRPADRCRRPSPLHRMHWHGEPRRRPAVGPRRIVLLLGAHRPGARRVDHGLCVRPRWPRTQRRP